jgi:hypothetical protein
MFSYTSTRESPSKGHLPKISMYRVIPRAQMSALLGLKLPLVAPRNQSQKLEQPKN